jgi:isoquinoline 1-oxidoreductase subunit alpha
MIRFELNGKVVESTESPETPLLWVVRDEFDLTGSKFGCGAGLCGACTMQIDGQAQRTCILPLSQVAGRAVTTIESLGTLAQPSRLQQIWAELAVPQCGYCQSGQLMSAHALLKRSPNPTDAEIIAAMSGNLCRCGTYDRIKAAIKVAAAEGAVS